MSNAKGKVKGKSGKVLVTVQLPADVVDALDKEGEPEGLVRAAVVRRVLLRHVRGCSVAVPA